MNEIEGDGTKKQPKVAKSEQKLAKIDTGWGATILSFCDTKINRPEKRTHFSAVVTKLQFLQLLQNYNFCSCCQITVFAVVAKLHFLQLLQNYNFCTCCKLQFLQLLQNYNVPTLSQMRTFWEWIGTKCSVLGTPYKERTNFRGWTFTTLLAKDNTNIALFKSTIKTP